MIRALEWFLALEVILMIVLFFIFVIQTIAGAL